MSSDLNLIATRYADALFNFSAEQKQQEEVKKDMLTLQSAFKESKDLRSFIVNPVITRAQAEQVISGVLETIKASEPTKKFFALLARERRLEAAPEAVQKFLAMLAESRGELSVQVASATPLGKEQIVALTDTLSKSTGKKVTMETSENPELIGGIQLRVGSKLLDYSVIGKLTRMRLALTRAA